MDQTFITRIVEAALLASPQPLTVAQLRALFTLDEQAPEGSVEQALQTLGEQCAERGIELVEVASGWRFQVRGDVHAWVGRLWTERQTKYTRATLETLAIIAYRQPITRGEIEQVRGVAVSSNIIKALEEREWIRSVGHRDMPGRPELLGTTKTFLDYFGLRSLDELPALSELKDFAELEPQLSFADPDAPKPQGAIAANVSTNAGDDDHADHDRTGAQDADDADNGIDTNADAANDDGDNTRDDAGSAAADSADAAPAGTDLAGTSLASMAVGDTALADMDLADTASDTPSDTTADTGDTADAAPTHTTEHTALVADDDSAGVPHD
jgi:segregation and condensation protein B